MNVFSFICLSFLLGCLCGISVATIEVLGFLTAFFVVFLIKIIIFKARTSENLCILIIAMTFSFGALYGFVYDRASFNEVEKQYGKQINVTGTVVSCDDKSFVIDSERYSYRVYDYADKYSASINDVVAVSGVLKAYPRAQFKGDFDSGLNNAVKGIYGKIYADSIEYIKKDNSLSVRNLGVNIRSFIISSINKNISGENIGLTKALLVGDTSGLDAEVRDNFRLTGISHLVAVSGLHFGVFFAFFSVALKRTQKKRVLNFILVSLLVVLYMVIIGERASVIRAGIMIAYAGFFTMTRLRSDSVMSLMSAGVLICVLNPYYAVDPGFQMSFLASLGLILFAGKFKHRVIAVPVVSMLFMLPVTMYYYNIISFDSVLVNLLVVGLIPVFISLGYVSCFIPFISGSVSFMAWLIMKIADIFSSVDFFHITIASPEPVVFVIWFLLACIVYFVFDGFRFDDIVATCALILVVCFCSFVPYLYEKPNTMLSFVNTGTGNMLHIVTENGKNILINCGYNVLEYTKKTGVKSIDAVIITKMNSSDCPVIENFCNTAAPARVYVPIKYYESKMELEKSEIIYYNQSDFQFSADNVYMRSDVKNDDIRFWISVYGTKIAMPVNTKSLSNMGECDVIMVPDGCVDCDGFAFLGMAEYYIHPTCNYKYYDYGHKYITALEGGISLKLYPDKGPFVIK